MIIGDTRLYDARAGGGDSEVYVLHPSTNRSVRKIKKVQNEKPNYIMFTNRKR